MVRRLLKHLTSLPWYPVVLMVGASVLLSAGATVAAGAYLMQKLEESVRMKKETYEVIGALFRTYSGLPTSGSTNKAFPALQRIVESCIEKYEIVLNDKIKELVMKHHGDDISYVASTAEEAFGSSVPTFGRITSLLVFGALVCKHLKDNGRAHCVDDVVEQISSILLIKQQNWLSHNFGSVSDAPLQGLSLAL